jgi:hypothetical protein
MKDGISSVRFLVRTNHYVRKEKQISSVNSGLATEGTSIFVSVPERNGRMRRLYADAREQGAGGQIKRLEETTTYENPFLDPLKVLLCLKT